MHCIYCERRCDLSRGGTGACGMYMEEGGTIKERFPNRWSTYTISHIESVPFFHAYPGSRSLVIGTAGCNFDCRYCSNSYVAKGETSELLPYMFSLSAEKLVEIARKTGCHNIVFNVNEPLVSLPSLLNLSRVAKTAGIPMGCLTNGYMTEESLELMESAFSFFNISLKGVSDEFYRNYTGVKSVKPVLRSIERLASTSHVEVITPIIQSVNDHEIEQMASYLAGIDREIPWHVFRLLPEYRMKDTVYPSIEHIRVRLDSVRPLLSYVYFHNFVGSDWVNTTCPDCGQVAIERFSMGACGGGKLAKYHCREGRCLVCGRIIKALGKRVEWNSKEVAL